MRSEIERVLTMVRDGALTPEQGAEMIAALRDVGADQAGATADAAIAASGADEPSVRPQAGGDDSAARGAEPEPRAEASRADRQESRHERHRRRRHHHRGAAHQRNFEHFGDEIERAMGVGARTLRWALKSRLQLKGGQWGGGDSNSAVLSRAEAPTGTDFVCEHNEFAVSHLEGLRLARATFAGNELNAASIQDFELIDSRVTGQRLRGSSIRGALLENGELTDNDFNGARVVDLKASGGRLTHCRFNGVQLRDLGIAASVVDDCRFNGTKLKTIVIRADSLVKGTTLNGVLGRNWLLDGAVVAGTQFVGLRVDGLVLKRCGLENVTFKSTDWVDRLETGSRALIRDTEIERVILKDCEFEDCRFDGTRLEGFDAANLKFRGVDFGGLTIKTADEFARLAGARNVA